jgi:hypothetical protein
MAGTWSASESTPRFDARPSITFDTKGRQWVAYEEGQQKWGKNFGALDDQDGNPLYFARTVRVICVENDKLLRPVAELPPLEPRMGSPDTGMKAEATLCLSQDRHRRQEPRLADLSAEVRQPLQRPSRPLLADLRPPARRRPLDRTDRNPSFGRPARRPPRSSPASGRRPAHHSHDRRPVYHAGNHRQSSLHELCRFTRRAGRAETGAL